MTNILEQNVHSKSLLFSNVSEITNIVFCLIFAINSINTL